MNILSAKISNILSIEEAYVEFDDTGLVLVCGWDHDSQRANGAGKTAIFNAITFALYDKLPRKITATEIVRRGFKTGYVEVALRLGQDRYTVRRSRPKGAAFTKNGSPLEMTQAEWESKLKLNYTQYLISAYCAQGTSTRFLSANDAEKKQFMLQLLNLEEFSTCKSIVDKKSKVLRDEESLLKAKLDTLSSKISAYGESLVNEDSVNDHISSNGKLIADMTATMISLQLVIKPDLSKYQKLEDDISFKRTEFTKARTTRDILHDQYRKLNSKKRPFNSKSECEACGSALDNSHAQIQHDREIVRIDEELLGIKSKIDECELALSKEKQVSELQNKLRDKKRDESRDYEVAANSISDLKSKIALKNQELKQLNLKLQNNLELQNKINDLGEQHVKVSNNRAIILRDIELYETISSIYSPTGAQAYILDSVIESFNERVSSYVGILWNNLSYELHSYKENVKGEVTAKFSETLIMNGVDISVGSLSGGELRALSLCVDFALMDVMERQFGISLSPIILDEPFDGLDGSGRELIIELLEVISKDRQIIVIDHASEVKSMFSKVINVQKKDGISKISLES